MICCNARHLSFILLLICHSALVGCWIPNQHMAGPSDGEDGLSPTAKQVDFYGIDYDELRSRARKDDGALRLFFFVGVLTDAAGSELYAANLTDMLEEIGEERFLRVLRTSPRDIQIVVADRLRYDNGGDGMATESWLAFPKKYPLLWEDLSVLLKEPYPSRF